MPALKKYLTHYAEKESRQLATFPGIFQQGLLIPIYREDSNILKHFISFAEQHPGTLLTLVINRPESDDGKQWGQHFFEYVSQVQWQSDNKLLTLHPLANNSSLLLIDRCLNGEPIPEKEGVGLARKIGADILCTLISEGKIKSPWIYNTDADALLPEQYFSAVNAVHKKTAAIIFPFEHIFVDKEIPKLPTMLYELSLHYYVDGLKWAGSPYAYHTIGSLIVVDYKHYAKVRGFPRRSAAEDFYLLNKLAKTGEIISLISPVIKLEARESTRVPFGTGPAVKKLTESEDWLAMPMYHPDSFRYLKAFLKLLDRLTDTEEPKNIEAISRELIAQHNGLAVEPLLSVMENQNLNKALEHSFSHGKDKISRLRHLNHWFDGFKTLKFIHILRDQHLGMISYKEWINKYQQQNMPLNSTISTLVKHISERSEV